ncbi:MAG: hypothetical protein HY015_03145 [Bacteroidetes bacterium]|nr:hypothetical protein [Bacteroidota bacterium]
MKIADIVSITLTIVTTVGFGWMFIIVVGKAFRSKEQSNKNEPHSMGAN